MNKRKCILLFLVIYTSLIYPQKTNDKLLHKVNARIFKVEYFNNDSIWKISNEKGILLNVNFLNNPYRITKNFKVRIILDHTILYDGIYKPLGIKIQIPISKLNVLTFPIFLVYNQDICYFFSRDQNCNFIRDTDTTMKIIFLPENDGETIYVDTLNWKETSR